MNLNKYTEKAQEAVLGAQRFAEQSSHAQIEPEHLLVSLVEQREGVVPEILRKMQVDPAELARAARDLLSRIPQAYGGAQPGISPRLKLVADLAEAEAGRLKDDFVSTVSHELRTPLTSIRAFSHILFNDPDTHLPRRKEFLGIIVTESERLTRLIDDVLDLAKLEAGRAKWHVTTLDLRDIVADAVAATGQLFRERAIALDTRIAVDAADVAADRDRVMQVLINLLSNAAKFCQAGTGRVELSLRQTDGFFQIDVADNGPGVAEHEQEYIFEKFRQAGDTLTSKPQGTGLGLPISRQIVEHFGGRLWLRSVPGAGATFSFTLPALFARAAVPSAREAVRSSP